MQLPKNTYLKDVPPELEGQVDHLLEQFLEKARELDVKAIENKSVMDLLKRVFACSEFVATQVMRQPGMLDELLDSGALQSRYSETSIAEKLDVLIAKLGDGARHDEKQFMVLLRQFRHQEMVRMTWRDLLGWAKTEETLFDLSLLAEVCVQRALDFSLHNLSQMFGVPRNAEGEVQEMCILGMGKLGGRELNFSSDIDLILAFTEEGETDGKKTLANSEFFIRVGQHLFRLLNEITADGFVYRVDLRLRPWGASGPLALSFSALEHYYQAHGRDWERYAMIKSRVINSSESAPELKAMLRPFTYRRYLDYGAFASLRDMKGMINHEIKQEGMQRNVKLGPGGIREIEFISQAFQLIRGGREPLLQHRSILRVLELLEKNGALTARPVNELKAAYLFLRKTENCLQMVADQQTHVLPEHSLAQLQLAYAMGFADWAAFKEVLDQHRDRVDGHFQQVFAAPQVTEAETTDPLMNLWLQPEAQGHTALLREVGFETPEVVLTQIQQFAKSHSFRLMGSRGQQQLAALVPLLIRAIVTSDNPEVTFSRIFNLLETVSRRTVYLTLMLETPMAISQLVHLCSASPWIATLLARYPILLDELMDPRTLYAPPQREELAAELANRLRGNEGDLEMQLDILRQFKQANMLRIAAADISGSLGVKKVSDHLTIVAEVLLETIIELAQDLLSVRHGWPMITADGQSRRAQLGVIGYGKFGGIELGYGSDLDLVFVHDSESGNQLTDGEKPLDHTLYFVRLAQKTLHLLTTITATGALYEVDMRLRPDGASGLLVISLAAYEKYQREKAWTWEHQALVRARLVVGSAVMEKNFNAIRRRVLGQQREPATLQQDVVDMREKMRANLGSASSATKGASQKDIFHLKQDVGGIADIEFMVQYAVLAWHQQCPDLLRHSDNFRQLEALAKCHLIETEKAQKLMQIYLQYRAKSHQLALQQLSLMMTNDEFREQREIVRNIWQAMMVSPS